MATMSPRDRWTGLQSTAAQGGDELPAPFESHQQVSTSSANGREGPNRYEDGEDLADLLRGLSSSQGECWLFLCFRFMRKA